MVIAVRKETNVKNTVLKTSFDNEEPRDSRWVSSSSPLVLSSRSCNNLAWPFERERSAIFWMIPTISAYTPILSGDLRSDFSESWRRMRPSIPCQIWGYAETKKTGGETRRTKAWESRGGPGQRTKSRTCYIPPLSTTSQRPPHSNHEENPPLEGVAWVGAEYVWWMNAESTE